MTIDEAIEYAKEQQEIFGGKHKEFLTNVAEWLEEFKAFKSDDFTQDLLNMGYTKGYRMAIDEFAEALLNWKPKDEEYRSFKDVCNEVAEQMKGV